MKITMMCSVFLLLIVPGCVREKTESLTHGSLHALIAESTAPAMVEEVNQFVALHADEGAQVSYEIVSSEEAVRRLVRDTVRFIVTTRPLTPSERQRASAVEGLELNETLVAYDGIAVIVNQANPVEQVAMEELQKIITGEFTRWDQLAGGKTAKGKIELLYQDSSDVSLYAEARILRGRAVRNDAVRCASSLETLRSVATRRASIGLVGLLWIDSARVSAKVLRAAETRQAQDTVFRVPAEAFGKFFSPHPANIYRTYYPLKRAIYIYTLGRLGSFASGLASFMANAEGQRLLLKRNIVPGTQHVRLKAPE
jgi:phosphate transport system substrate-binding protein